MQFELTEEQREIKQTIGKAFERLLPKRDEILRKVHHEKVFPQEMWDIFAAAGLFGALVPEEYGGTNLGLLPVVIATEEAARMGFGNTVAILTSMDALSIVRNGSEDLKRRFLPKIAAGEMKLCFALTEPDAGSNTFRISTTARDAGGDGKHYEVTGQKTFITGADITDYMLLVVRTTPIEELEKQGASKAFGLSLLLVDLKHTRGIEMRPIPTRGIEGMTQFTIFFDRARVPKENLVGEEGMGSFALFNTLNPERILAAATACGLTDFLLAKACGYARERKVFKDRPIGAYQAIQHPLAEIKIELEAARLMTYRAAWTFDKGEDPAVTGQWANMAKYLAAELAIKACDRAIETYGGYGFSEEYGIIYLGDATRLLRTAPITKEMILNYIAEHTLELPRSY